MVAVRATAVSGLRLLNAENLFIFLGEGVENLNLNFVLEVGLVLLVLIVVFLRAGGKQKNQSVDQRAGTDDMSPKPAFLNGSVSLSTETTVSITVVGASGDLAKKKIFPALFALYYEGCLPKVRMYAMIPECNLSIEFHFIRVNEIFVSVAPALHYLWIR